TRSKRDWSSDVCSSDLTLSIVKDLGLKDYFTGQVPLVSGEISEGFKYYFANSEQTPTAVGAAVLVNPDHSINVSGGFIIQLMPDAEEEIITHVVDGINQIQSVTTLLQEEAKPEELLQRIFAD